MNPASVLDVCAKLLQKYTNHLKAPRPLREGAYRHRVRCAALTSGRLLLEDTWDSAANNAFRLQGEMHRLQYMYQYMYQALTSEPLTLLANEHEWALHMNSADAAVCDELTLN